MESEESLKVPLHAKLNEFSTLTRQLLEVLLVDKSVAGVGPNESSSSNLTSILERMVQGDREMQQLVDAAVEMRVRQRKIDWVDAQLERRIQEIEDLQSRLHDAEKLLEFTVYHGQQKMESIKQAKEGAVNPEELIKYAHRISQASSAVSPVGWQPSDPRRPYPQDIEMRSGALGRLNSVILPPKEEKGATQLSQHVLAAGINQNNNKLVTCPPPLAGAQPTHEQAEAMSEDSSVSSTSDEEGQ